MTHRPHSRALHLRPVRTGVQVLAVASAALLAACAAMEQAGHHASQPGPASAAPPPTYLAPYLTTLQAMAPGDPARQEAELASTYAAAQHSPSFANNLRYALALGSAGHKDSNPGEAGRLLTNLLAGPNDLKPEERELAAAYLREFEARAALDAQVARQRDDYEQKLKLSDSSASHRADGLAADNAKLKKQLAEAQRKLEAVAEMERSLQEKAQPAPESPPPRP